MATLFGVAADSGRWHAQSPGCGGDDEIRAAWLSRAWPGRSLVAAAPALARVAPMSVDFRVCFFGDSFVAGTGDAGQAGWVGRVMASAVRAGVTATGYNLGIRGDSFSDVADRLVGEASLRFRAGDRHVIVLSAGVNDTPEGDGFADWQPGAVAGLDRVADLCARHDWAAFVVGPPLVGDDARNVRIGALSDACREACAQRSLTYLDVSSALEGDAEWREAVRRGDGVHPDDSGYQQLADIIESTFIDWLSQLR